jgi:hypothetical protein
MPMLVVDIPRRPSGFRMRDGDVVTVEAIARAAVQLRRCDGDDDQGDTGPADFVRCGGGGQGDPGPGRFFRCGGDDDQGDTGPADFARCGGDRGATSPGRLNRCG